ncbi:MAG: 3,4-dihydroxy-2-butanone-4-phosphate synthase [Methanophagales archaeon ANME-1-THS]|nr:MAG: 3,4-dihydroxy-2-butanone-4-phosphate synthase [Methanophagales archaeon ANME-1-THS]
MRTMNIPTSVQRGIESIQRGELVLLYDAEDREGETDFVLPASFVTPQMVAHFRTEAGGLICVAIHPLAAERLGLPLMSEILRNMNETYSYLRRIVEEKGDLLYDKRSSFSLWVNHRDTFTGITDRDRALTIRKIGEAVERVLNSKPLLSLSGSRERGQSPRFRRQRGEAPLDDCSYNFYTEFRTPGHVSILRAADRLLDERRGQTELSVALAMLAGMPPAMVICEMLDSESGGAVSKAQAKAYASKHNLAFLEGKEIVEAFHAHCAP